MDNEADVNCQGHIKRPERTDVTLDTETVSSSAPEKRKSSKPIMEKRRRARINASLTELKTFLLDMIKKEGLRHNKMEKTDILELTVKHLRQLQKYKFTNNGKTNDTNCDDTFRKGFSECASEVTKFLKGLPDIHPNLQAQLLEHLLKYKDLDKKPKCINNSMDISTNCAPTSTRMIENLYPYKNTPYLLSHNGNVEQIPDTALQYGNVSTSCKTDGRSVQQKNQSASNFIFDSSNSSKILDRCMNSQHSGVQQVNVNSNQQLGNMISGVQIIPTKLESGQTAYIIPANIVTNTCLLNYIVPVLSSSCINIASQQVTDSGQQDSLSISRPSDHVNCFQPLASSTGPLRCDSNNFVINTRSLNPTGLHINNTNNVEISNVHMLQNMNNDVIDNEVWRPW